jgi:lipoprotein Spr
MKRFVPLVAVLVLLGCEPSIRYSAAPSKSDANVTAGGIEEPVGGTRRSASVVDAERMSRIIKGYLGTPYRSGGYGKLGVDCSGLVYAVYRDYANLHLPPNSRKLFGKLRRVSAQNLRYGDLVFFSLNGKHASHVGIYVGNDKFAHASVSRGVIVSSLEDKSYRGSFVGARRVLE